MYGLGYERIIMVSVVELEFLEASLQERKTNKDIAEICSVLNRIPEARRNHEDANLIDLVDILTDDLYRRGKLSCPGHRWLPELPVSIRGHLIALFERGYIWKDRTRNLWIWKECTSNFVVWARDTDREMS